MTPLSRLTALLDMDINAGHPRATATGYWAEVATWWLEHGDQVRDLIEAALKRCEAEPQLVTSERHAEAANALVDAVAPFLREQP